MSDKRLYKDLEIYNQRNGKGSKYRFYNTDKKYQENYNKIFRKKDE